MCKKYYYHRIDIMLFLCVCGPMLLRQKKNMPERNKHDKIRSDKSPYFPLPWTRCRKDCIHQKQIEVFPLHLRQKYNVLLLLLLNTTWLSWIPCVKQRETIKQTNIRSKTIQRKTIYGGFWWRLGSRYTVEEVKYPWTNWCLENSSVISLPYLIWSYHLSQGMESHH